MTSHLNSHRTTDIKPEMLSGVQTGNGTQHAIYNICGIAHARTNRKDDIFMQRRLVQNFTFVLEWGQGTCSLTKHSRHWAYSRYFSLHAAYSALWHFLEMCDFVDQVDLKSITRHKVTFFMPHFCVFTESFRSNTQVSRNSFDFLQLWRGVTQKFIVVFDQFKS